MEICPCSAPPTKTFENDEEPKPASEEAGAPEEAGSKCPEDTSSKCSTEKSDGGTDEARSEASTEPAGVTSSSDALQQLQLELEKAKKTVQQYHAVLSSCTGPVEGDSC